MGWILCFGLVCVHRTGALDLALARQSKHYQTAGLQSNFDRWD